MEYACNGDLFEHITQLPKKQGLSLQQLHKIVQQLIDAIAYLHMKGISHMDVKLENILLDNEFNVKLIDFGFATSDNVIQCIKGTS